MKKKKYVVRLMTIYMVWEDVEAESAADAIRGCDYPEEFDLNEPHEWKVEEVEGEEDEK